VSALAPKEVSVCYEAHYQVGFPSSDTDGWMILSTFEE
jgi:hypothetical protein